VQINKELISTDIYTAKNQVVSVGTKKAQEQNPVEAKPGQDNQEQVVPQ